ncbi:hypothetical protein HF1_03140 [Mycoplasma haemofelis str. Langford 1]|uniref:Uncharacterized protein n=1 Tax=Mycoplasma haemofelis (strain Langford 1) TaxID=941640 RepID=E8ZGQ1_MYCHL|nr:hypothetical protein [Mycoplasma haemofelis]CBY92322.1 hypothetical protein HF1_03140 [Mycoplasma haemofelis str. Langford 1]
MTNLAKGAITFGALGSTAGGIYLGKEILSEKEDKSIRGYLLRKGSKLISDLSEQEGVNEQWTEEFKSDKEEIKKLLGTSENGDEAGGRLLKAWCEGHISRDYSQTYKDLGKVEKYCLLRTIQSQLSRNKKKLLTSASADDGEWEATYNKRKETTSRSPRSQIEGLEGQWNGDTKAKDLPIIKAWCSKGAQDLFLAKKKDAYTNIENWCTKEGADVSA